jgi:predicted peroxiredoxin
MAKLLIHVTRGPEDPTRAALAFLVGRAASESGHEVTLFLAADAVQLLRDSVLSTLSGLGTGRLQESYDALVEAGARFHLSGGSSGARGVEEGDLAGKPAELAQPARLVELVFEHDRVLTY